MGKAMALFLARKGYSIAIHYNHSDVEARALAKELLCHYPSQRFCTFQANMEDLPKVEGLMDEIERRMGIPNLLINNASIFEAGSIAETRLELLERMMTVNFTAPFLLMQDFSRRQTNGVIVNIADCRIMKNNSAHSAYTLSKKALWELTKMAAVEFAPSVRVNALAPGLVLPPEGKDENYLKQLAGNIPLRRPGGMDPVLKSLDYILGNDYLTGQLLFCDGGENLI